jgi:hypothetical protein
MTFVLSAELLDSSLSADLLDSSHLNNEAYLNQFQIQENLHLFLIMDFLLRGCFDHHSLNHV